jgi:hypothetical protein
MEKKRVLLVATPPPELDAIHVAVITKVPMTADS